MNFETFNFHPSIAAGILKAGYVTPTPIQIQAIKPIMKHQDVMGLAQTGTGKTAAFVLPVLNRLFRSQGNGARALIMAPTRELAEQICHEFETLGQKTRLKCTTIYGGVSINPQIQRLKRVDIVVACPGRLLDHIRRRTIDLSQLEVLIIDEADQMFDMGFLPDIKKILMHLPQRRQTLLFSATMPNAIRNLARDILRNPVTVEIGKTAPAETVSHALYPVSQHQKAALLLKLLDNTKAASILVFTRTKHRAKSLGKKLTISGYRTASLQGDLSQKKRQSALEGFRNGSYQILVATDIAARGIDVTRVSHVINFDMPSTPEAYIHRIGRTGRAARSGEAYTLVTDDDKNMIRAITKIIDTKIEERILPTFDYNTKFSIQNDRQQRQRKTRCNISRKNNIRSKNSLRIIP